MSLDTDNVILFPITISIDLESKKPLPRSMIRERVKAGIANARENGKPHERLKNASLKKDEIKKLKSRGLNNSQIAKKLNISRGLGINQLKTNLMHVGYG